MHQWKLMTGLDCDELRMAWVMTYLKEPVCPFAGTFVMIVGALPGLFIPSDKLLLCSILIITGVVPGYK